MYYVLRYVMYIINAVCTLGGSTAVVIAGCC